MVQERLLRGQAAGGEDTRRQPGFGHPVHRHGDPRAAPLLASVYDIATPADRELVERTVRAAAAPPNSDFALGALCYVARMPAYAATAVFAVARTAGWIAHAAEEYTEPAVRFRGRAVTPAVTRPSPRRGSYPAGAPPRELPGRRRAAGVTRPAPSSGSCRATAAAGVTQPPARRR
jgi:citrate synthase